MKSISLLSQPFNGCQPPLNYLCGKTIVLVCLLPVCFMLSLSDNASVIFLWVFFGSFLLSISWLLFWHSDVLVHHHREVKVYSASPQKWWKLTWSVISYPVSIVLVLWTVKKLYKGCYARLLLCRGFMLYLQDFERSGYDVEIFF